MAASPDGRSRLPLSERNRPARWEDFAGNAAAVAELRRWAASWRKGPPRRRAALLEGPAGVGKTTAALVLASEMGWGVVEMNASDARNRKAIEEVAGRTSITSTLDPEAGFLSPAHGGRTLLLLDEADCLSGRASEDGGSKPRPASFREFLQTRYRTLDALNAAWDLPEKGTPSRFDQWSELPATPGRAAWAKRPAAQRDIADWRDAAAPRDTTDRGGLGAMAKLVRETRQPLILTVNDAQVLTRYSPVFRVGVVRIRFDPLSRDEVKRVVRRVVMRESIALHSSALERILERSGGDVRSALNDVEAISPLPAGPNQARTLGTRDRSTDFFDLIGAVFSAPRIWRSVEVRDRLDVMPDDLLPWVEENLPRFVADPRRRADGFRTLGEAELLLSRARRYRVWALWSFATELMTGGVAVAAGASGAAPLRPLAFPQFLAEMGRSRALRAARGSLLGKVGRSLHLSRRKAGAEFLPMLGEIATAAASPRAPMALHSAMREWASHLELTREELAFLLGREVESTEVLRLVGEEVSEEPRPGGGGRPPPEGKVESGGAETPPSGGTGPGRTTGQRTLTDS